MPSRHPVLVDSHAAAAAVNVRPATIRKWISLGYLQKYGTDEHGRSLVELGAVYRCAAARRRESAPHSAK